MSSIGITNKTSTVPSNTNVKPIYSEVLPSQVSKPESNSSILNLGFTQTEFATNINSSNSNIVSPPTENSLFPSVTQTPLAAHQELQSSYFRSGSPSGIDDNQIFLPNSVSQTETTLPTEVDEQKFNFIPAYSFSASDLGIELPSAFITSEIPLPIIDEEIPQTIIDEEPQLQATNFTAVLRYGINPDSFRSLGVPKITQSIKLYNPNESWSCEWETLYARMSQFKIGDIIQVENRDFEVIQATDYIDINGKTQKLCSVLVKSLEDIPGISGYFNNVSIIKK